MKKTEPNSLSSDPREPRLRSVTTLVMCGQWHLAGVTLACAAVLMSLASLYGLQQTALHAMELAAHSLAFAVEPALRFQDLEALQELTQQLAERERLASVTVLNKDGRPLVHFERPAQDLIDRLARLVAGRIMHDAVYAVVQSGPIRLGEVRLMSGGRELLSDLVRMLGALSVCSTLTGLAVLGASRGLARQIVSPLNALVDLTRDLRTDTRSTSRAQASVVLEFNALAGAFNALLTELQSQQDQLETRHLELQLSNASLRHASLHDGLTGLPNRRHLFQHLTWVSERCEDNAQQAAMVFIDVDHFKRVNDDHGHAAGDALLIELTKRLKVAIGHSDFVARLGGDEFMLVLWPLRSAFEVPRRLRQVRQLLQDPMCLNPPKGPRIPMSVSFGVSLFPQPGRRLDELIREADDAMYRDKARSDRSPAQLQPT